MGTFRKSPFQTPQTPQGDHSASAPVAGHSNHPWPYTQAMARRAQPRRGLRAAQMLARTWPPAISGQGGHNTTFALACELARRGLQAEGILRVLMNDYNGRCQPPWTEAELQHKAEDAYARVLVGGEAADEPTNASPTLDSQ
jgi:hypothetical protein